MNSQPKNSTICITNLIDKLQTNQVVYENVGRGGKILPESDRRQLPYTKLAKDIIKSIDKYTNADPSTIVVCQECGFISKDLSCHISKHRMNVEIYQDKYPNTKIKSDILMSAVSGDKNPAFNHGGKFSPYSKKFIKYENLCKEDVAAQISTIQSKAQTTLIQNCNLNTKPDYYIKRGAQYDDAVEMVQNRQRTFTLEKCIDSFGIQDGTEIWKARQDKWQAQLNIKTDEQKNAINKSKTSKVNYKSLWQNTLDCVGYLYIIKFGDHVKFGITTKDRLQKRYKQSTLKHCDILLYKKLDNIQHAFQVEQIIKSQFYENINKADYGEFGWTEVIPHQSGNDVVLLAETYINDSQLTAKKFEELYGHTKRFS